MPTEPFRDGEGELDVGIDTLRQTPETQEVDTSANESHDVEPGFDPDTLTLDDKRDLELLERKRRVFRARGVEGRADALEQEMADIAGVEDYDEIELDAL